MLIPTEINNSTNRPTLVAISDSKDGLYKCGEIVELIQDCGYTLNVILRGHLCCVVSEHFRQQT